MNERYTVQARLIRRVGPDKFLYNEGDTVTGDQLRAHGLDVERLLTTGHIVVCKAKAEKPAPVPAPVPVPAELDRAVTVTAADSAGKADAPGAKGRGRVSDG